MTHEVGPVPLNSNDYVERTFEVETAVRLINRDWVLVLGPRQHGKTSAFIRVKAALQDAGLKCAFVDLQSLPPNLNFEQLLHWFAREVANSLGHSLAEVTADRANEIEAWLEAAVAFDGTRVVVLIDEASAIEDDGIRNAFFGQIRALKTRAAQAPADSLVARLQFAFAGTFRQETLVTDQNSPFNVSRRIETEDLQLQGARSLAEIAFPGRENHSAIAQAIFDHVGGQPHLLQHLLGIAADAPAGLEIEAINAEVERLKCEGSDHLDGVFRLVFADSALTRLARTAATNGFVENDAANPDSRYMVAVGLMKRDGTKLVFRNPLYEHLARSSSQLRPEAASNQTAHHLIAVSEAAFTFVGDAELREIAAAAHDGAVNAYNSGHYRLALIGFGICVEAMLLDWLSQQGSAAISSAVANAKAANPPDKATFKNGENETRPSSWRLVNLMRVSRVLGGIRGPMELPESLRNMRNFVHPMVMKTTYIPEAALEPEARGASALISAVRRDLTP